MWKASFPAGSALNAEFQVSLWEGGRWHWVLILRVGGGGSLNIPPNIWGVKGTLSLNVSSRAELPLGAVGWTGTSATSQCCWNGLDCQGEGWMKKFGWIPSWRFMSIIKGSFVATSGVAYFIHLWKWDALALQASFCGWFVGAELPRTLLQPLLPICSPGFGKGSLGSHPRGARASPADDVSINSTK